MRVNPSQITVFAKVDNGSTATYIYDAEGQRVRKTTGSSSVDYLYDLAGHEITELSSAGVWNRGEVYAGGRHLARGETRAAKPATATKATTASYSATVHSHLGQEVLRTPMQGRAGSQTHSHSSTPPLGRTRRK